MIDHTDIASFRPRNLVDVQVRSDLVVVGYDPEFADFENQRGAIVRQHYYVEARVCGCTVEGVRFQHEHVFEDAAAAQRFADRVLAAFFAGRRPDPALWGFTGFVYGSEAYQRLGGEQDLISWEADRPW